VVSAARDKEELTIKESVANDLDTCNSNGLRELLEASQTVCSLVRSRAASTRTTPSGIQCSSPTGTTEVPSKQLSC
jgi:hypothetical protein